MIADLKGKISELELILSDILNELEALPPIKLDEYSELVLEKIYDFTDKLSIAEDIPFVGSKDCLSSDSDYDFYHEDEIEHYVDDEDTLP